jgi:hypothetical protein
MKKSTKVFIGVLAGAGTVGGLIYALTRKPAAASGTIATSSNVKVGDTLTFGTTGITFKINSVYTAGTVLPGGTSFNENGFMTTENGGGYTNVTTFLSDATIDAGGFYFV